MLKAEADPNAKDAAGRTPLFQINQPLPSPTTPEDLPRILADRLAILEALIAAGADINARDPAGGRTVLLNVAVFEGWKGLFKALIEQGADVNAREVGGDPALTLIVERRSGSLSRDERIPMLIAAGIDVNAKGPSGSALDILREITARMPRYEEDAKPVIAWVIAAGAK